MTLKSYSFFSVIIELKINTKCPDFECLSIYYINSELESLVIILASFSK